MPLFHILGFITYLFRIRSLTPGTVTCYISAVKAWEVLRGYQNDDWSHPLVKLVLRGYRNLALTQLKPTRIRSVITWPVLRLFRAGRLQLHLSEMDTQVFWTAGLVSFWGSTRMGELLQGKMGFDKIRMMSWEKVAVVLCKLCM